MRAIAADNGSLPEGFMVPAAWNVMKEYYNNKML